MTTKTPATILAWHFLKANMTTTSGHDTKPWKVGQKRSVHGPLIICKHGFHSSPTPGDAGPYAPGSMLCLVEISQPADTQPDKYVSRTRKLLQAVDVSALQREIVCDLADELMAQEEAAGLTVPQACKDSVAAGRAYLRGEINDEELAIFFRASYGFAFAFAYASASAAAYVTYSASTANTTAYAYASANAGTVYAYASASAAAKQKLTERAIKLFDPELVARWRAQS